MGIFCPGSQLHFVLCSLNGNSNNNADTAIFDEIQNGGSQGRRQSPVAGTGDSGFNRGCLLCLFSTVHCL